MEDQRVMMVIQDASKQVCSSAIKWLIHSSLLIPGDSLVLLGVLHTPVVSVKGTKKLLGYSKKVDSSSKFAANLSFVDREAARKKEFENSAEVLEISKLCKAKKVEFRIELTSGTSPAVEAMQAAQDMNATWVILDRKMKKNKKIFLEKLSCGISRMKKDDGIKLLRGPRTKVCVTYDDMMPGNPDDDDLFSIELFPTCGSEANEVGQNQKLTRTSSSADSNISLQAEETFENPGCIICDNSYDPSIEWRKDFTYAELYAATEGFSTMNVISQLGFECTFRGQLEHEQNIVIKPAKHNMFFQEIMEFKSEVEKLIRISTHKNLVMLLGCCAEGTNRLLVYKYVCNGSLDQHLSEDQPVPLSWTQRIKAAVGAAKGLSHLHQNNIIHNSIRSSNIFLNHDFESSIGDFGLATMASDQNNMQTQADVYSFGMVLLEIITGKMAMENNLEHEGFLTWARTLLKQRRYFELVDPRIGDSHDVFQVYKMAQLVQKCLSKNPKKRLPMDKVVSTLEYIVENKLGTSKPTHNCGKTMEVDENWHEDEDVTREMKSRSFSGNFWSSQSSGISSSADGSYKSRRAIRTGSSSQIHYGEMLN